MNKVIIATKKQAAILEAARTLFWKHGFRRITIEEICQEAKVSKMTFYRYFPDKLALAKTVFDLEVDRSIRRFKEIMAADDSPADKIQNMLLMKAESVHNISQEFLKDFYRENETGLSTYIAERNLTTWNELIIDYKDAQKRGIFRDDFKPEFLLYFAQKLTEMMDDPYLIDLYGSPENVIMEIVGILTYGIAPKQPQ